MLKNIKIETKLFLEPKYEILIHIKNGVHFSSDPLVFCMYVCLYLSLPITFLLPPRYCYKKVEESKREEQIESVHVALSWNEYNISFEMIHPVLVFSYNWAGLNLFVKLCGWSRYSVLHYIEFLLLLLQIYKLAAIIQSFDTAVIYRIVMHYIVYRSWCILCMY